MNLLIITQKIDRNDGVLGFFHRWVEKFAEQFSAITVICLEKGEGRLPKNVTVLSLGKENGRSRLKYLVNFYRFIIGQRNQYQAVLVHMTPIYILLGKPLWRRWNKKLFLWYNHEHGNRMTRSAVRSADKAFYTSPYSFCARFKNTVQMPAGVDTDHFRRDREITRGNHTLLSLGRISPIKNIEVLIEAAQILQARNIDLKIDIVGTPLKENAGYFGQLKVLSQDLETRGKIIYHGKIPNYQTPAVYNRSRLFVNLSPAGLFDKTILEAMACECLVLVCGRAFTGNIDPRFMFKENDPADLANKIMALLKLSDSEKDSHGKELRRFALENHSLKKLSQKLTRILSE